MQEKHHRIWSKTFVNRSRLTKVKHRRNSLATIKANQSARRTSVNVLFISMRFDSLLFCKWFFFPRCRLKRASKKWYEWLRLEEEIDSLLQNNCWSKKWMKRYSSREASLRKSSFQRKNQNWVFRMGKFASGSSFRIWVAFENHQVFLDLSMKNFDSLQCFSERYRKPKIFSLFLNCASMCYILHRDDRSR